VAWFLTRHPLLDAVAGVLLLIWLNAGWPALAALAGVILAVLIGLRVWRPEWFARFVTQPVRCRWRWWFYRRHWQAVLTVAGLAPVYRGTVVLPLLVKVEAGGCTDRLTIRLVSGQTPGDFADRAESLAHGFRALLCRVRSGSPGALVLELVRRDALAEPMTALPVPADPDLKALPVGRREDGLPFTLKLSGTHLLIAGATGAGKGSYLWGLIRAMLPLMAAGLVQVWACDP
jgi:S-DNA-T family DNA segregation ATPase FtsK/SpoIIIE